MAGETPGASRANKNRKRTRLDFPDLPKSADNKYYASGQPSVINNTPADSRGGVNTPPQPIPTPEFRSDERSADRKYYGAQRPLRGNRPKKQSLRPAAASTEAGAPATAPQHTMSPRALANLEIRLRHDVNPVMDEVVRRLQSGEQQVVVHVTEKQAMRARTKLDSLVTRELITEDQYRDVRFSQLAEEPELVSAPLPPPKPLTSLAPVAMPTVTKDLDQPDDLNIDDVLSGAAEADDSLAVDTTPQEVVEYDSNDTTASWGKPPELNVEVTGIGGCPQAEAVAGDPETEADDADDGDEYLAPGDDEAASPEAPLDGDVDVDAEEDKEDAGSPESDVTDEAE